MSEPDPAAGATRRRHRDVPPNLVDYEATRAAFSWADAAAALDGLPGGAGLNIAHEAVDRHVAHGRGDHVALRHLDPHGPAVDVTYTALAAETGRFANALAALGVGPGDRVFSLTGRIPELYVAVLGTLKARAVFCPLFSAFGPDPVHQRLSLGHARVLVTTPPLYRRKVAGLRDRLPGLTDVLLVGAGPDDLTELADLADATTDPTPGWTVRSFEALMADASPNYVIRPTAASDPALLHFTSGTTGVPKGAVHVHEAVVAHHATAGFALDLHPDDVFWCTADPGWVTGTSYGIIAPLTHGVTTIVDPADFDAERWYGILETHGVDVWYTAPTAIRMLMKAGTDLARAHDLGRLRVVASVGEPLHAGAVEWGREAFGHPILDNWWQTETGGIMIANFRGTEVRPGSMGRPVPGVDAAIVEVDDDNAPVLDHAGDPVLVTEPDHDGMLALRRGWPSMFRAYLDQDERYRACFAGDWYLTGDLASRDADGFHRFVGRADDVIKTAGHLVGPFEVESALLQHPAVVEAAVIGLPDPVAGNVLKAFVTLAPGVEATDALRLELIGFGRSHLGPAIAPRQLAFDDHLPRTRSGKIMRRLLRARELGLAEGDLSTLEAGAGS